MSLKEQRARDRYRKKLSQGNRGFPVATVSFYGPSDRKATKIVVALVRDEGEGVVELERWTSEGDEDLRHDSESTRRIIALLDEWRPKSIVSVDRIIGCPHEEGIDYPDGESCPECPFWVNRDRWTGEVL